MDTYSPNNVPDEDPIYEMPDGSGNDLDDSLEHLGRSLGELGASIFNRVDEAVRSADFDGLAQNVSQTIASGVDKANQAVQRATAGAQQPQAQQQSQQPQRQLARVITSKTKSLGALLKTFGGGYLVTLFGFVDIACLTVLIEDGLDPASALVALLMGAGTFFSWRFFKRSRSERRMFKALEAWKQTLGNREEASVGELAFDANISEKDAYGAVRQALSSGYIPGARLGVLPSGEERLFLSDEAFERMGARDPGEPEAIPQTTTASKSPVAPNGYEGATATVDTRAQAGTGTQASDRVTQILQEGNSYLVRIRAANAVITENDMSNKLYELEENVRRILVGVQEDPSRASRLQQFMSYYLPTTGKLVDAYADLDRRGEQGPTAQQTRQEIKDTLDVINDSFEKLSDDLLAREARDLKTEMNVMKTMLAQDGLTDDGPQADPPAPGADAGIPNLKF